MATITGKVVDAHGYPISEASVTIANEPADSDHPDIAAITNNDGEFELSGLNSGKYSFLITASGYDHAVVSVRFPSKRLKKNIGIILEFAGIPEL